MVWYVLATVDSLDHHLRSILNVKPQNPVSLVPQSAKALAMHSRAQEKVERLTGQLVRSKWGGLAQVPPTSAVATENQAVQTDRYKPRERNAGEAEDEDDEDGRNRSGTAESDVTIGLDDVESQRRRRRRRAKNVSSNRYGCFSGMLDTGASC